MHVARGFLEYQVNATPRIIQCGGAYRKTALLPFALGLHSAHGHLRGVNVMATKLKRQLSELTYGDHICLIYETPAEQMAAVVTFIIDGLTRGERCVYFIDDPANIEEVVQALEAAGVDVAQERQRGALQLRNSKDTYLRGGEFVPHEMIALIRQAETEALADGFSGLRLTGEPTWSLGPEPGCDRLIEYEALLNRLPAHSKSVILCQYHHSRFGVPCIHDILRTHPVAILGDQVCPNSYYESPEMVLNGDQEVTTSEVKAKRVDWWISQLKRRKKAEQERERANTAHRESEGRLRDIVDLIPAAVYVCDKNGIIQQFNKKAVELWGREPFADEDVRFCGAVQHLRLDGSAIPRDELPIAETIRNGKPVRNQELVIERGDGSRLVVMVNVAPLRNAEGTVVGAINCFVDVTDRHEAAQRLRQSERRLAEAQQVAHIGSWERDLGTNQVTWSDEMYRLFGVKADEIGLSYERFLSFLVPQEVDRLRALVDQAIDERGPLDFDYRIIRPDGSVRVLHEQGSVIVNGAGEPIRLVGTAQDVTDRRRVEQMLEENQRLLHTVLFTLPVGVLVTDRQACVILANPAYERIWGHVIVSGHERRAQSKGFWHDSGKRIDPESWASVRALREGQTSLNELIDIETFDGQQKTIQNSVAPIRDAEGLIVGAVVVNEDVTDRVRAQKALRESADRLQHLSRRLLAVQEEERRHLARELHDEFGQILASITLHLHAVRGLAGDGARSRLDECLTLLNQAGEQVRRLAIELRPTMLDTLGLEATLRWLAEQHQQRTGCPVQVVGHLTGSPLPPDLSIACFRVVQEALTNIVRHAAARQVWIELSQSENVLELGVRDDGVGFEVAPTQEQAARRERLGLLGMTERVHLLGGTLHVESEPGRGTRIRASFPLREASEEQANPEE